MPTHYLACLARRALVFAVPLSALAMGAGPVGAQIEGDEMGVPHGALEIPADARFLTNADPRIRKPTAVVNGQIITLTDVDQRLALIITANGSNVPAEEKEKLRVQVLRNLIDETLQIQEAAANDIKVSADEIGQNYARVAANFKQAPNQFDAYLRKQGSSAASIKRQIEGEIAWSRLLRRKVQPFVSVSEDEVNSIIDRMKAAKGSDEIKVGEIYLSATPENATQIEANMRHIIEQIRQGGSFQAYARQFSEASTASVGGDLGWLRPAQLPDQLSSVLAGMTVGQIAGPIPVPGGFSLVVLADKRQVLMADPRDALLSLKQLTIHFPANTTQAQAAPRVAAFSEALAKTRGCGAAEETGKALNAELIDSDNIRVRDLPPALQTMMTSLQIGQATPPFGSLETGVRALILCGRDDPDTATAPSFDQIMSDIEAERVNKRAQIYLRDLRRDAIIEYN